MKDLNAYVDGFGLVCTKPAQNVWDGGDTCADEMTMRYVRESLSPKMVNVQGNMHALRCLYDAENNVFVRHPDASKWYSEPNRLSRDQLKPLLNFLCIPKLNKAYRPYKKHLMVSHAKRGFLFAWNTRKNFQYPTAEEHAQKSTPDVKWDYKWKMPDLTGPEIWATYIRSFPLIAKILWPLLLILDLELLLSSVFIRLANLFGKDTADQRNHILAVHFANKYTPTVTSYAARKLYGRRIPEAAMKKRFTDEPSQPPVDTFLAKLYNKF